MTALSASSPTAPPEGGVGPSASLLGDHRPFLVALALGVLVRVWVQVAFVPAFVHSDAPTYLAALENLVPAPDRPLGYVLLLLLPASLVTPDVLLVALVQHVLGLALAVLLYVFLRRWGVGPRVSTVAALPVLLDTMQLSLEHAVLSDVLFEVLVFGALCLLCWHRRMRLFNALAAGLALGLAATVRLVGEPLVVVAVIGCVLLAGPGWRRRVAAIILVGVGFAVPVTTYMTWYHQERGGFTLAEFTGKALYVRSASFVECDQISVQEYQRVLCPREPVAQRQDSTYYAFHDPQTLPMLRPPPGVTTDQAMREFAIAAIRAQPLDYTRTVVRDFSLNFDVWRGNRFSYDTAYKWRFKHFVTVQPTDWTGPAYAAHGGRQLQSVQPFADGLVVYAWVVYLPGPLLLGAVVVALGATLGIGRAARRDALQARAVVCVLLLAGLLLLAAPAVGAQFVWRYQLPALALVPAAAALGWTILRGGGGGSQRELGAAGTEATASTD
ncbi:MAG: phospholipid carrier-dependent glycosyltransferase [Actinobacteria bacterium]|nr:phospholipid carrier-dependent glycosyltransferase [Actinomycetota bacterium]